MSGRKAADGVLSFRTQEDFRKWLEANHRQSQGLWLRIFKKGSGKSSINYSEALEEALCFGWIDGQKQRQGELSWLQRFTPRRRKSGWSRINTEHASRLMEAGRMTAAGQTESMPRNGTGAGGLPTIPRAGQPFLGNSSQHSAKIKKRRNSSIRSTRPIATPSPTGYRRQRSRKPGSVACS